MPGKLIKRTLPMPADWIERQRALYAVLDSNPTYPQNRFKGRGIVTCAGGKYFPPAWVLLNMLRKHGCELPIEVWYLGPNEMNDAIREAISLIENVTLIDAYEMKMKHPIRKLGGWESKPFAIINSSFEEVLFLDGDNVPVKNPEFMFEHAAYKKHGSVFWPDYERLGRDRSIWQICKLTPIWEEEFETGQMLINKKECWLSLILTMHMNEWSEFYYNHIWGDKDTFHMAWHVAKQPYYMIPHPIFRLPKTMCQQDPEGKRLFQHRNLAKFGIIVNERIPGFMFEEECLNFIKFLKPKDFGEKRITEQAKNSIFSIAADSYFQQIIKDKYYKLNKGGTSRKVVEFDSDGYIKRGRSATECGWHLGIDNNTLTLFLTDINGVPTAKLVRLSESRWKGHLVGQVRYSIELKRK